MAQTGGAVIQIWREARGLSLKQFGQNLGLSEGSMSRIERGLQPIGEDLLFKLDRFGVDANELRPDLAKIFHRKLRSSKAV